MMPKLSIRGLVIVFVYVPSVMCGNVSLGYLEIETISSVECSSLEDIIFDFISDSENKSRFTVAACDASQKSCHLSDQSLGRSYSISYTGSGARFSVVKTVEKSNGKYYCCQAYSKVDCVQFELHSPFYNVSENITEENNQDKSDLYQVQQLSLKNERMLIAVIFLSVICVALLFAVVVLFQKIKGRSFPSCWRKQRTRRATSSRTRTDETKHAQYIEIPMKKDDWMPDESVAQPSSTNEVSCAETSPLVEVTVTNRASAIAERGPEEYSHERKIGMETPITYGDLLAALNYVFENKTRTIGKGGNSNANLAVNRNKRDSLSFLDLDIDRSGGGERRQQYDMSSRLQLREILTDVSMCRRIKPMPKTEQEENCGNDLEETNARGINYDTQRKSQVDANAELAQDTDFYVYPNLRSSRKDKSRNPDLDLHDLVTLREMLAAVKQDRHKKQTLNNKQGKPDTDSPVDLTGDK